MSRDRTRLASSLPAKSYIRAAISGKDNPMLPGLDVSHWEGTIDWKTVSAAGYKFAYTKATESTTYVDDTLKPNVEGANAAGIPIGAYHFYRLAADPKAQADFFLAKIKDLKLDLPP